MFFIAEIIVIAIHVGTIKFFIYLSHQSLTVFVLYTIWSAMSVTFKFLQVHLFNRKKFKDWEDKVEHELMQVPKGCCGINSDSTSWYQKVHWLLFVVGAEMALAVTLLQSMYRPATDPNPNYLNHETAVLYLVKGIVPVLDTLFTSTPVQLLHAVYLALIGSVYVVFHGLYFAFNGTDPAGNQAIYSVLNYETNPAARGGLSAVFVVVYLPLVHLLFFALHLLREALSYFTKKKCSRPKRLVEKIEKEIPL